MDIGALSIGLSQMKLSQEVGVSVLKMAMDTPEAGVAGLLQVLETNTKIMGQSINPNIGGNIDISL